MDIDLSVIPELPDLKNAKKGETYQISSILLKKRLIEVLNMARFGDNKIIVTKYNKPFVVIANPDKVP